MENATESEEEGEIVEYEPLPRPLQESSKKMCDLPDVDSDNDDNDDLSLELKKPKLASSVKNKYNVWSSELQESQLMDELNCWDAGLKSTAIDRSRSVESYYYYPPGGSESDKNGVLKRRYGEEVDMTSRMNHPNKDRHLYAKSHPRCLVDLRVTADDTAEDVACDIANKLGEEKEDLVLQVVNVLGQKKAIDVFLETKKIEEEGGMLVMNGSRRRTPGGIFLYLVKNDSEISPEQEELIFMEDKPFGRKKRSASGKYDKNSLSPMYDEKDMGGDLTDHTSDHHSENDQETLVKNPPPSPATDGEQLDDRCPTSYEDMFDLDGDTEMDL